MKKPSGYYVQLVLKVLKTDQEMPKKILGLDFGVKSAIATSNGYEMDYKRHPKFDKYIKRIKGLQQARARKKKGSRRYRRLNFLIARTYERLENIKREIKNKLVSLFKKYRLVFQDEMIAEWKQSEYKSVRRTLQGIALGKLKEHLKLLDYITVLNKSIATTKTCLKCGQKNDIDLSRRTYECPNCGYTMPRDIHSALNMLRNVGLTYEECLSSPNIQFSFSSLEIMKLEQVGIRVSKVR